MACNLAQQFQQLINKDVHENLTFQYLKPYLAISNQNEEAYQLEESGPDIQYVKFNNQCGFVNQQDPNSYNARLPQAFTHWTYQMSNYRLIIVDVQGWKLGQGNYLLTDPLLVTIEEDESIYSKSKFGSLMKGCMKQHECNYICNALELKNDQSEKQ